MTTAEARAHWLAANTVRGRGAVTRNVLTLDPAKPDTARNFHSIAQVRQALQYLGHCPGVRLADREQLRELDSLPCGNDSCGRCLVANTLRQCPACAAAVHSNIRHCDCGHTFGSRGGSGGSATAGTGAASDDGSRAQSRSRSGTSGSGGRRPEFSSSLAHVVEVLQREFASSTSSPTDPLNLHGLTPGFALFVCHPGDDKRWFVAENFGHGLGKTLHNIDVAVDVNPHTTAHLSRDELAVQVLSGMVPTDAGEPSAAEAIANVSQALSDAAHAIGSLKRRLYELHAASLPSGVAASIVASAKAIAEAKRDGRHPGSTAPAAAAASAAANPSATVVVGGGRADPMATNVVVDPETDVEAEPLHMHQTYEFEGQPSAELEHPQQQLQEAAESLPAKRRKEQAAKRKH